MATVKIKNTDAVRKLVGSKFKVAITKMLRNKELRLKVGKIVVDDIQDKFKAIPAPATVEARKTLEKKNATHPKYKRSNINITFTGELLEDLMKNVKANTNQLQIILEHSDKKHKLYKLVTKARGPRKRSSYKEISDGIIGLGYDYMDITKSASDKITKLIQKELFKILKGQFK